MSGLIGHTMYGLLCLKEVKARGLAVTRLIERHLPSYLCGAYLGCDIQVMPEAVCVDSGREFGFGTVPVEKSPFTGGAVKPWVLLHDGRSFRPTEIHRMFYGRSHLVFGWAKDDIRLAVPWDHLADYCALCIRDSLQAGSGLAYALGWMVHIVGDSLIKSVQPGLRMRLLDGVYTPRNRIVQDQFTFHTIGDELGIDWEETFRGMASTPVESIQAHYMRIANPIGALGRTFDDGWRPDLATLLDAVLLENRRWLAQHMHDVLDVVQTTGGRASEIALRASGGLDHDAMLSLAEAAGMRATLMFIADQCADLIERVSTLVPEWNSLPPEPRKPWNRLKTS